MWPLRYLTLTIRRQICRRMCPTLKSTGEGSLWGEILRGRGWPTKAKQHCGIKEKHMELSYSKDYFLIFNKTISLITTLLLYVDLRSSSVTDKPTRSTWCWHLAWQFIGFSPSSSDRWRWNLPGSVQEQRCWYYCNSLSNEGNFLQYNAMPRRNNEHSSKCNSPAVFVLTSRWCIRFPHS